MNRRQVIMLSGAALAARETVHAQTATAISATAIKTLMKYNRARTSYQIPKSDDKGTKYVGSLSAALELSIGQQQEATRIFSVATATRASLRTQYKSARQTLRDAIYANDANAIGQAATTLGTLKAQLITAGTTAHSAFYQMLSSGQQARLLQYRA